MQDGLGRFGANLRTSFVLRPKLRSIYGAYSNCADLSTKNRVRPCQVVPGKLETADVGSVGKGF